MKPDGSDDREAQLEAHIRELTARVYRLEETVLRLSQEMAPWDSEIPAAFSRNAPAPLVGAPGAMPGALPPQEIATPPAIEHPQFRAPHVAFYTGMDAIPATREDRAQQTRTLESKIGSQWFNRIGILAVLIGMAWFLKLAIDNHWIGPLGRVLIGLLAGGGLIAWSERFQRKGYKAFSYSLKAVGSGILYLSLWAAFSLYQLIPSSVAFVAMILVTAFNAFLSWKQDAELLALYAIAGGLTTPLLLSTGGNHEITLLTYLLMLDVAALALVILKPWSRLLFAAFAGSVVFFAGWWVEFYSADQLGRTAAFLTCFFLIFSLAPRLVRVELPEGSPTSPWDGLALVILPIANAALAFVAYYALFDEISHEWAGAFVAVAMAAFYLLLIQLPHRGVLRASTALVSSLHLTVAIVFLTIAIPLRAHGRWLTIGWLVEGVALFWLANKRNSLLLRVLSLCCLVLGLCALLIAGAHASATPFLNTRFGTYLVGIVVFALVAWMEHTEAAKEELEARTSSHRPRLDRPLSDHNMGSAAAVLVVNALILLSLGLEIHSFWWSGNRPGEWRSLEPYEMYAQFSYSALFMIFGAILLAIGFSRRSAFVRWQALVLLAISIGKVFLLDVSKLSQGYRILSFIGLGALLLGISFVYQRDWLHLRNAATHDASHEDSAS